MLVEVVLQTFVGKVDAELFEAVVLVILKTKNVQNSDGQDLIRGTEASQRSYAFIMRHYLDGEDQQHIPAATTHLKQLSKRNHKLENVVKNILAASFVINPNASRTSVAVVYCVSPCVCGPTLVVSTRSLTLSRAWLILKTIQSNRALYRDLAMESRTVPA